MTFELEYLAGLAWAQLWQVTVVTLVIGAMVRVGCRDRPRLANALWMIVVIKSIVPPIWSSPTSLFSWALASDEVERMALPTNGSGEPRFSPITTPLGENMASANRSIQERSNFWRGVDWTQFQLAMLWIWGTGLTLCVALVVAKLIAARNLLRRSRRPLDLKYTRALEQVSRRLCVKREVGLIVTSQPIGPAVFGLLRPAILLPEPLLPDMSLEQLELILAHELIHVRRGDILAGKLQLVARLIWWFNPLIWWANRETSRERERCCDQEVVSGIGCKPALYARTLLRVLEQKGRLRSLVAIPGVRALEVTSLRLESIMRYSKTDDRRTSLIAKVVFAAGAILLVPGTGLTIRAHSPAIDNPSAATTAEVAVEATQDTAKVSHQPTKASRNPDDSDPDGQSDLRVANGRLLWAEEMYRKGFVSKSQLEREREKVQQAKAAQIKADLSRAEDRLEWAERMFQKGYISKATLVLERENLRRVKAEQQPAKLELEEAEEKAELSRAQDRLDWAERMFRKGYVSKTTLDREREAVQKLRSRQTAGVAAVVAKTGRVTVTGVVREKGNGRPVAGARVSEPDAKSSAVTDATGRFSLTELPQSAEYKVVAMAKPGEPFFITSRTVKATKDASAVTVDLEFVRGIPLRVRVLDKETGTPLKGNLSYFPISPNDPFKRGATGYVSGPGIICGAFYEASANDEGQYLGAVLPGPGIVCFSHPYRPGDEARADRNPEISFPDGKDKIELQPNDAGGPIAFVPIASKPIQWTGLPLGQYDAVIAINPRESAEVVTYEIRIAPDKTPK